MTQPQPVPLTGSAGPLPRLVELACRAPSVHNTQPWLWRIVGDRIRLYADRTRLLPAEDPDGRNLVISCGAALHHYRFAARALGWEAETNRFPAGPDSDLLAELGPVHAAPVRTAAHELAVLRSRCTDRRRFTAWPVPDRLLAALVDEASAAGARALAVDDVVDRFRLELLANHAHAVHRADREGTIEQQRWVGRPGPDGVPVEVLPETGSRFGSGLVSETRSVMQSGDAVIVLGGAADDPTAWLRTGEALSALWLHATRAGLSVVPLSLPTEIDAVRHELCDRVLHGAFAPHLLIRVGWQAIGRSELPRTLRRPLCEVLG